MQLWVMLLVHVACLRLWSTSALLALHAVYWHCRTR
jgi:hypothetical protein